MTPAEQIHEKIQRLKQALDEQNPGMEGYLREIHSNLHKDESLVQLLADEEIGIIVSGCERKAKMVIVAEAVKSKPNSKKLGGLVLDDI